MSLIISIQKVYPYNGNIDNFLDRLNPSGINYGNTATSDLNLIFRTVLANTKGSTLGVMISDGIYSIDGDKSTILTKLKSEAKKTRNGFIKRLNEDNIETLVFKLHSNFDGNYYPAGSPTVNINQTRPYYIWFFGHWDVIRIAKRLINATELPGYQNEAHYFLNPDTIIEYSIINHKKIGQSKFPYDQEYLKKELIECEPLSHGPSAGMFGFTVAVDISDYPLDNNYIKDSKELPYF